MADLQYFRGGIAQIAALTDDGAEWLKEHVHTEPWQWRGGAFACEPSYALDLLYGAQESGLTLEDDQGRAFRLEPAS